MPIGNLSFVIGSLHIWGYHTGMPITTTQLPTTLEMLRKLLETPSVSSTDAGRDQGNLALIELLAQWLDCLGFDIRILPLPGRPDKANLLASLGTGPGGLVLSGHTDTVPFDAQRWKTDPFQLTRRDGLLYGLGATDMKGFFPAALEAAAQFADQKLNQPLILLATADEESSMDGARALVALGQPKARYAVIGEPTGLRPVRAHKGIMMESINVAGQSGHSSNPALGVSALEAMHQVIGELLQLRRELQRRYRDPSFTLPEPTLNLGSIHGGDNPNRICGACELSFDLRPVPGMESETLRSIIDERLAVLARRTGASIRRQPLVDPVPPFAEDPHSVLVSACEEITGYGAGSVAFATEGPLLQQLGMQAVVLGPGSIDQAHQPDEHLREDQFERATSVYCKLIQRFCATEESTPDG